MLVEVVPGYDGVYWIAVLQQCRLLFLKSRMVAPSSVLIRAPRTDHSRGTVQSNTGVPEATSLMSTRINS